MGVEFIFHELNCLLIKNNLSPIDISDFSYSEYYSGIDDVLSMLLDYSELLANRQDKEYIREIINQF